MSSCSQQAMEADSETLQNVSAQMSFNPQSTRVGVENYVSVLEILPDTKSKKCSLSIICQQIE